MIAIGSRSHAERTRRDRVYRDGSIWKKSEWMLGDRDQALSPTVFLIEQPADRTLPAHFHHNNQFQIFVGGAGKIGARPTEPVTVHYAGAYTAYGPISAGEQGVQYFTLRSRFEEGGVYVSDAKGKWPDGPRRHATSKPVPLRSADALRDLGAIETSVVIPRADDGLAVDCHMLPPEAGVPAMLPDVAAGIFLFVLQGELCIGDVTLAEHESMFVSADEAMPSGVAGPQGVQFLALAIPQRDPAYAG